MLVFPMYSRNVQITEAHKKRLFVRRMVVVYGILLVCSLTLLARLLELQIVHGSDYQRIALRIHSRDIELNPRRGEIFAINSRSTESSILATNTSFDFVYVDPTEVDDVALVAETLADLFVTQMTHDLCSQGHEQCPRELITFASSPYAPLFDPLRSVAMTDSGVLLTAPTLPSPQPPPPLPEVRRLFARDIEIRITEKYLTFVPLKYSATNTEIATVAALGIAGISINRESRLIFADPEEINQSVVPSIARQLAEALLLEPTSIEHSLSRRRLRYVPIMRRVPSPVSLALKEILLQSLTQTNEKRRQLKRREDIDAVKDPFRGIAIVSEDWRYYPDDTIASQVVGFVRPDNDRQVAEYGVERAFDGQMRGKKGRISMLKDEQQGVVLAGKQTIEDAKDGDSVFLTIDPFVQKEVERIMQESLERYRADSAQAIVMDPLTGGIVAMVNAPLFSRTSYASVYAKEPLVLTPDKERDIVLDVYHPATQVHIAKAYQWQLTTDEGRAMLSDKIQHALAEVLHEFDLKDISRYYLYLGKDGNARMEIFPTAIPGVWLQFRNTIGVGAYLNKTVQEIYEPGSVMKPVTMAIALDQGEVSPQTVFHDDGPIKVDTFVIDNAGGNHYGKVTMTDCLAYSINTCMASVSERLGKKLFHSMLSRFGFGQITGIPLEDELPGRLKPWRDWSNSELANAAYGQGVSVTPLQMIVAFAALANGGKLLQPMLVDHVLHPDGTVEYTQSQVLDQVITPASAEIITAMLVSATRYGYAKKGKVPGYTIAGKTGTSQIAYKGGWETGTGSTIGTYMGYGPATNPKFILLVKFDRPKNALISYGENTAGPTFREIAAFLFKYYGIAPDER